MMLQHTTALFPAMEAPTTVVGVVVALLLLIAFGVLSPRWYVKRIEKNEEYIRETSRIQAETIRDQEKTIHTQAKSILAFESLGTMVKKFVEAAQESHDQRRSE